MSKFDSMWIFSKISFALGFFTELMSVIADKKLTVDEIVRLVNMLLMAFAEDVKIKSTDINIAMKEDGGVSVDLAAEFVQKLAKKLD